MKYVYYIVAIVIIFSGLAAYGLFDTRIEISEPVLSINDRIYSDAELEKLLKIEPFDMTREQFIQSLIEKQLLIQQAIKMDINKEENFRQSVQNFYEQSLIKILMDRKLDSLVVDVTTEEVARYEELTQKKLTITKLIYPGMVDLKNRTNETIEVINTEFINLSDDLKFIVLNLNKGESSNPQNRWETGAVIYRLDDIKPIEKTANDREKVFDVKQVSLFIQGKKKEQLLEKWIASIRESADIWRKK
ncbi:MAG: hypothetical protein ABIJ59_12060 [Pseudomonadota bacterium]